jgi:hypothetical protein
MCASTLSGVQPSYTTDEDFARHFSLLVLIDLQSL